jgi:hypothetical protein
MKSQIDLKRMKDNEIFWNVLENALITVEEFYLCNPYSLIVSYFKAQEDIMLKQFNSLTKQAVKLVTSNINSLHLQGLIPKYNPLEKTSESRLERELSRLRLPGISIKHEDLPKDSPKGSSIQ